MLNQPHRAAVEVHQHPLVRVHVEALRVLNLKLIREQGLERRNKLNHHLPVAYKSMINMCSLQMLFSFLFLAVQDSSLGDLVTRSLTHSLRQ